MSQTITKNNLDNRKLFGVFSLLASISAFLLLFLTLIQKPPQQNELLIHIESHKGIYILFAGLSLTWSIISIPVIIAIGFLAKRLEQVALTYTSIVLTSAGILLSGIISFISIAVSLVVVSTKSISGANVDFEITFWSNLFYYLTDPALMIWGLGQFLIGLQLLKLSIFPKWVNLLILSGGIAGLLTLIVFQTTALAIFQHLTFLILTTYSCIHFFRKQNAT